ncbi:MAG: YihA family ribosome biogenesis GTP-binding protein [Flavobacteriales bacterium]|nr:YihA family ribosome biogenesis GTP-binding protein [Flavobacteriales bacterium]
MRVTTSEFVVSSAKVEQCPKTEKPEFAFIGRSNVGKSSLTNMLCDRKSMAKTSGAPGKTRLINHFIVNDAWYLVDLPGFGYAKVSKKDRASFMKLIYNYFEQRENMVNAFVLVDCRVEPQKIDLDFMEWLGTKGIPFTVIFTKIDKMNSAELGKNLERYKKKMLETWEELPKFFLSSATSRHGKDEILNYINYCIGVYEESFSDT